MDRKHALSWPALGLALVALMLLSGCSGLAATSEAAAGGPVTNSLSVSGYGEATAPPDVAYANLGVVTIGQEVSTTVDISNRTMQAIMEALAGEGVEDTDMQTAGFNVWTEDRLDTPVASEGGGDPARVYHVENSLRVTIREVDKLGDIIQAGLDAGANQVHSVNFSIEDTSSLEDEARTLAVEDARARAAALADEIGVTLGDPISISETPAGGAMPETAVYGLGGGGGGPPISSGQLSVGVQVHVTFSITSE